MNWKNYFKSGKQIILATTSPKNIPNANIVISQGIVDDCLLIADCQMNNTIKNLRKNKNICVIGGYFRIRGKAKIFKSGKYFDLCTKNNDGYEVKNAVLISIDEIFNLDKGRLINK